MLNNVVQVPPLSMFVTFNLCRLRSDQRSCTWTKVGSMWKNRVRHRSNVPKPPQVTNQSLNPIVPCSEVRLTIQYANVSGRRQRANGRARRRRIYRRRRNVIIWVGIIWIMMGSPHRNSISWKLTRTIAVMINVWRRWRNVLWKMLWVKVERSRDERRQGSWLLNNG